LNVKRLDLALETNSSIGFASNCSEEFHKRDARE
jgi:hypothetical protein